MSSVVIFLSIQVPCDVNLNLWSMRSFCYWYVSISLAWYFSVIFFSLWDSKTWSFSYGCLNYRQWKIMYTGLEGRGVQDQWAKLLHSTLIVIWYFVLHLFLLLPFILASTCGWLLRLIVSAFCRCLWHR